MTITKINLIFIKFVPNLLLANKALFKNVWSKKHYHCA
jgi:hypothetical protein